MSVTQVKSTVTSIPSGTATITGTVTANQGTANSDANAWPVKITDGVGIATVGTLPAGVAPLPTGLYTGAFNYVFSPSTDAWAYLAGRNGGIFVQGLGAVESEVTENDWPVIICGVDDSDIKHFFRMDDVGNLFTKPAITATTVSTDTEVSVTGSSTQLLAANSNRKKVFIQNHGTGYVRVRLAATALTTSPIRLVPAVGTYELKMEGGYIYTGVINAISETGTNAVGVIEET